MGRLKEAAKESAKTHILSEREWQYVKLLNVALEFHTLKDQLITGFLVLICTERLDYPKDINLAFNMDLGNDSRELSVTIVTDKGK
jgi:hypothetical protein